MAKTSFATGFHLDADVKTLSPDGLQKFAVSLRDYIAELREEEEKVGVSLADKQREVKNIQAQKDSVFSEIAQAREDAQKELEEIKTKSRSSQKSADEALLGLDKAKKALAKERADIDDLIIKNENLVAGHKALVEKNTSLLSATSQTITDSNIASERAKLDVERARREVDSMIELQGKLNSRGADIQQKEMDALNREKSSNEKTRLVGEREVELNAKENSIRQWESNLVSEREKIDSLVAVVKEQQEYIVKKEVELGLPKSKEYAIPKQAPKTTPEDAARVAAEKEAKERGEEVTEDKEDKLVGAVGAVKKVKKSKK